MTSTEVRTRGGERAGDTGLDVVTGAFSYSGRAIADELTGQGRGGPHLDGTPRASRGGNRD